MANPVVGSIYTAVMTFADRANHPLDPAFIIFSYRKPQTNQLVQSTLAQNPTLFRHISTGRWEYDIPLSEYGAYKVRYETDLGAVEGVFSVSKSEVL